VAPDGGRATQAVEDSFEEAIDFLEAEPEGETVEAFAESVSRPSKEESVEVESLDDDLFLEADEELNADDDDFLNDKKTSQESTGTLSDEDIDDFLSDI
jgi:hypothetical protein